MDFVANPILEGYNRLLELKCSHHKKEMTIMRHGGDVS